MSCQGYPLRTGALHRLLSIYIKIIPNSKFQNAHITPVKNTVIFHFGWIEKWIR